MKKKFILLVTYILFGKPLIVFPQWAPLNSGTTSVLTHVMFLNNDTGFVSQDNVGIRRTMDGGLNWTYINTGITLFDFHFFSVDTGVCMSYNGIYRTTNGGTVWNPVFIDASFVWFGNLFCLNNNNIYVSAESSTLFDSIHYFTSYDKGLNWTHEAFYGSSFLPKVYFTSQNVGYISSGGYIYRTTNAGATWSNTYIDSVDAFESNYFISDSTGFILGDYATLYKTTDWGVTWTSPNTNGNNDVKRAMAFASPTIGYVVGGNGLSAGFILKTTDAGDNWALDYAPTVTMLDVCFPSANIGYACGEGGVIIKYTGPNQVNQYTNSIKSFSFSPNPVTNELRIQNAELKIKEIEIYNVLGEKVYSQQQITNSKQQTVDVSQLPSGIYFLKIGSEKEEHIAKFVKQ